VLDESKAPLYKWFPDGEINICYNALDKHIERGHGDEIAFIYESAYLSISERFTYKEVHNRVGRIASILTKRFGVTKGDRVLLYMPMIPVSTFFMLACARIGAIHSVVFGGFAAKELANRIEDCRPKVIITASCGLEPGKVIKYRPIVDEALRLAEQKMENAKKSIKRIIVQRKDLHEEKDIPSDEYFDYDDLLSEEEEIAPCVPVQSTHPLYILCK
jgi:propionyl-CoA synthetase